MTENKSVPDSVPITTTIPRHSFDTHAAQRAEIDVCMFAESVRSARVSVLCGKRGRGMHALARQAATAVCETGSDGAGQGFPREITVFFDANAAPPLPALLQAICRATHGLTDEVAAPSITELGALADLLDRLSRGRSLRLVIVLEHFECCLGPSALSGSDALIDELVLAANHPSLAASFLLIVDEAAEALLARLQTRIPGLYDNFLRLEQDRAGAQDGAPEAADAANDHGAGPVAHGGARAQSANDPLPFASPLRWPAANREVRVVQLLRAVAMPLTLALLFAGEAAVVLRMEEPDSTARWSNHAVRPVVPAPTVSGSQPAPAADSGDTAQAFDPAVPRGTASQPSAPQPDDATQADEPTQADDTTQADAATDGRVVAMVVTPAATDAVTHAPPSRNVGRSRIEARAAHAAKASRTPRAAPRVVAAAPERVHDADAAPNYLAPLLSWAQARWEVGKEARASALARDQACGGDPFNQLKRISGEDAGYVCAGASRKLSFVKK